MLALLALACTAADSDTGPVDTDSDTAELPWPATLPDCAGFDTPRPLATGDQVTAAWVDRPSFDVIGLAVGQLGDRGDDVGCVPFTTQDCTDTVPATTCATAALTVTGAATVTGCDDGGGWTWEGFDAVGDDGWRFAADGTADAEMSGTVRETFAMTATFAGVCPDGACDGDYAWSGTHVVDGTEDTRDQQVITGLGGLCLDQQVTPVDGCPQEGHGWTALQGANAAVIAWDGDVACDGCGHLRVDGVDLGAFCP